MAMLEIIVGGTKHYRVFGIPLTWVDVAHSKELALQKSCAIFGLVNN
jgi:hypothetical protein